MDEVRTFPFMVVAANSFASGVASEEESIEVVIVQASGYLEQIAMRQVH